MARAAAGAGTIMCLSTLATATWDEIAATGATRWFQLYVPRDEGLAAALVERSARSRLRGDRAHGRHAGARAGASATSATGFTIQHDARPRGAAPARADAAHRARGHVAVVAHVGRRRAVRRVDRAARRAQGDPDRRGRAARLRARRGRDRRLEPRRPAARRRRGDDRRAARGRRGGRRPDRGARRRRDQARHRRREGARARRPRRPRRAGRPSGGSPSTASRAPLACSSCSAPRSSSPCSSSAAARRPSSRARTSRVPPDPVATLEFA